MNGNFPLSDWLKPRLGKKYNAIANAQLVSRHILLVADNVIDVNFLCDATYVFLKHLFHEIHVIKQSFYFSSVNTMVKLYLPR